MLLFFLFVFIVGAYECLYDIENLSLLNLGILCVHFYFNIYLRLSQGWRTLLDRQQTFKYVKLLMQGVLNDL
jgi:hypothetical protein